MIFDDFVLHNAHTGLSNSQLCQRDTLLIRCHGCLKKDSVNLLLCEGGKLFLCFFHGSDSLLECFHAVDGFRGFVLWFFCHRNPP